MRIVGLVGPKRSGKTTAAEVLVRERGFVSIGFADALKELALKVNPFVRFSGMYAPLTEYIALHNGWEGAKELPEVRRFLQELGTGVRDIDPDFWINAWYARHRSLDYPQSIVVPDVRFKNEADEVRHKGGLLIRVIRPATVDPDTHISETEQNSITCPVNILNDGDRVAFQADVVNAVTTWMAGVHA